MNLKASAKSVLTIAGRVFPPATPRVVVLCYHSIHPTKHFASATPEQFRAQLHWLRANCELISFRDVLNATSAGSGSRPLVAITFDDGYADNYEYALPLLSEFEATATFFVTVGLIEKDQDVVEHLISLRHPAQGEDVKGLEWWQVQSLHDSGMEIGSHTYSHPNLARIPPERVDVELRRSKSLLEDRIGSEITTLAYPFGKPRIHFNDAVLTAAETAGYRFAAAIHFRGVRASDSPLSIPRFFATRNSVETLSAKVTGTWDLIGKMQSRAPLWLSKRTSPRDFEFE